MAQRSRSIIIFELNNINFLQLKKKEEEERLRQEMQEANENNANE